MIAVKNKHFGGFINITIPTHQSQDRPPPARSPTARHAVVCVVFIYMAFQIPAWNEERLDDGDEDGDQDKGKDKKASRKAWPPPGSNNDGGKLDPQGDDGSGREADGQSATSRSVPASSSSSSWTAEVGGPIKSPCGVSCEDCSRSFPVRK